ncbi:MAG: aminotransferase class IV [Synergistaceae bacterium]|jgi:branched-chain amino acid aminotransferase|nr:aminotransferase class IV [Synergistaceae bacterium]
MSICFFEGEFRPTGECRLPVTDLAIQRGVGVFDSIRIYKKRAFALEPHMERLRESAVTAGIAIGGMIDRIRDAVRSGAKRDDCPDDGDCICKTYITGGDVNDCGRFPEPRSFVIFESGPEIVEEEYERGVSLHPTAEGRPFPRVKSINYLVGLMEAAERHDVMECLYCPGGKITETLRSSFFLCIGGRLVTSPVGEVLGGVTRNIVLELAREAGIAVEERSPGVSELRSSDEAFLTSSWKEVMPVVKVGDALIGGGRPGPMAKRLLAMFRSSLDRWLD